MPACPCAEELAEGLRGDHLDPTVAIEGEEIIITRDKILGPCLERTSDNHVVLGIAADAGERWSVREGREGSVQELREGCDLIVGVGIAPADTGVDQDRPLGLCDYCFREGERKNSSNGLAEECTRKTTWPKERADQGGCQSWSCQGSSLTGHIW
jgi:hypothetical protein